MTRINIIQNKIIEMEGGIFQNLCDGYLYKKYQFKNIHSLGSQEGTNKTTRGVPDSYIRHEDGTYTFIMYGHQKSYKNKISDDIKECLEDNTKKVSCSNIRKIIVCHTSTNITTIEDKKFRDLGQGVEIELIGLDTISHDLNSPIYQDIAKDFLGIKFDSNQIFSIDEFVEVYDKGGLTAPLDVDFKFREKDTAEVVELIENNSAVLISGASGIGKTRLTLEVCRTMERLNYQVYCVKSNRQSLYDDFIMTVSEPGRYLFLLDDVNETADIQAIVSFIQSLSETIEIKILATVRDYEKGTISNLLHDFQKYSEKTISALTEEEIKTILEESLEIKSKSFQDRIVKISKGNVRLAIFFGKSAIDDAKSVNDVTGIFKAYYGKILDEQILDKKTLKCLFITSLLGTVKINDNDFADILLNEFNMTWTEFREISQRLHQSELVDYYFEEVVKVNDQSFKDYILEYSLIERKFISIVRLLELGLKNNRKQIISTINTLFNIFQSEETSKYIKEQIKKRWSEIGEEEEDLYLESFYSIDYLKALIILKNRVENFQKTESSITEEDFIRKSNYKVINSKEISILSAFKYSGYLKEAVELLIKSLESRPDWFMDIYFAFSNMIYDEHSYYSDYAEEYSLLEKVWSLRKEDHNFIFLLLKIIDNILSCSGTFTSEGISYKSLTFTNFTIRLSKGIESIRNLCWKILSELYKDKDYEKQIHIILIGNHWNGVVENIIPIFEFDMEAIKKYFVVSWEEPTFEQCLVLQRLVSLSNNFKVKIDSKFEVYKTSKEYQYYDVIFSEDRLEHLSSYQDKRNERIANKVKDYDLRAYQKLFSVANLAEINLNSTISYSVGDNLYIAVRSCNNESLSEILRVYFQQGAPFSGNLTSIISRLLDLKGFEVTYSFIMQQDFSSKDIWLNVIWEYISEDMISLKEIELFLEHIESQCQKKHPRIPRLSTVLKFSKMDSSVFNQASKIIAKYSESKPALSHTFLLEYYNKPEELVELFSNDLELLEKMYFSSNIDYKGKILLEIIKKDSSFWEIFTKSIEITQIKDGNNQEIFKNVWGLNNYRILMDIAYQNIVVPTDKFYFSFGKHEIIFPIESNTNSKINENIKEWVLEFIKKNIDNLESMKKIFSVFVANQNVQDRIEYISEFLTHNKKCEDFVKLSLIPSSRMFEGSQVPSIDVDIQFWEKLISSDVLGGLDFLEHKAVINDRIELLKRARTNVLLREYQEDF